jgi:hypothetical protein
VSKPTERECKKCRQQLPMSQFYLRNNNYSGDRLSHYMTVCKECNTKVVGQKQVLQRLAPLSVAEILEELGATLAHCELLRDELERRTQQEHRP